ncbi:MAG TPA: hybrid sensor histidine kinase/response regulator [Crocinitomix sp.]|nr:hybrid sensor histidine kinase/response regulator [Crocinitomix sp.]
MSWNLFSQENSFFHFGKEQGLSQESIQCIIKDQEGFIWIGTQEGLNRFDGVEFKVFKNDFEDENSLAGNDVEKLVELGNYIFIGSKNNGVCYYDKTLNLFFKTGIDLGTCTSLTICDNSIYASVLNQGLYKIETNKNKFTSVKLPLNFKGSVTSLYTIKNNIYFGTNQGFIYSFTPSSNNKIEQLAKTESNEIIKTIYSKDNILWLGTSNGLYKMDAANNLNIIHLKQFNTTQKKTSINKIFNYNNNLYLASNNGLLVLNDFNSSINSFNKSNLFTGDKNNLNSITSNRIYDFLFYNDLLWIGTNKLDVLNLKKSIFNVINTKTKPSINNNHIYSIFKTNDYLFVGTRNGLNCIDNSGTSTIITKENTNQKLTNNVIRGINLDNNNNLWLATTNGVSVIDLDNFNPKQPKITSIFNKTTSKNSLSNNNTRNIFIDNNNKIWVATYGGGINLFTGNLKTNTITFKRYVNNLNKNSLSSNFTFGIKQTIDNTYWISTENGLNKLTFNQNNYENSKFKIYNKNLKNSSSLKSNSILTTAPDKQDAHILWVGSENGLHKFDINKEQFTYFGTKKGLTNTVIYSILEDLSKQLWVSTNSGIFKFNKDTENFINYTVKDGLKNIEFNLGAELFDSQNNILYFGGTNGLNYFNPKALKSLYREGKLVFSELIVKEKEINPFEKNKILQKNILITQEIKLKHNDFPTKIKFADLNYSFSQSSDFVYKLLPNDTDWNPLKNQKEIQLLNLKVGDYQLLIQGKGKEKIWSKKPLKLNIVVSPPWYRSNLAYVIYTLLLLSLISLFYRFQLEKKLGLQEVNRLKEINNLKTKLYANITHEFRTPITVILGMLQSIKEKAKISKLNIDKPAELIERNSKNLLNLVNQILDLSKLEKGKLQLNLEKGNIIKHLRYLTESFHSYAEEKGSTLVFYNETDEILMDYDPNKITQILSNLLSNAIKFCNENDKIVVHVKEKIKDKQPTLIVKVKDTGIGISEENLPFIFDRFYQAENNLNNKYDGTGIGLALTKELVKLMDGDITVKSKSNKGTTFTFLLPITTKSNKTSIIITEIETKQPAYTSEKIEDLSDLDDLKPICLIVEDNKDVATYIKMCLENTYQILYAKNGKIGIDMALQYIPDIIISDIMMPIKNGFELCQTIKEDIKTNHIPIVLLTAKTSQDDKISGLKLGADAYLIKPFNKEELLIRVENLIDLRKSLQTKYSDLKILVKAPKTNTISDKFIQSVIEQINKNLSNNNFTSQQLAEALFLSDSQLYRKLKALTNNSTAIFIRKIRLQKAKELIDNTNRTVSQVTYETGFNDPSWFSRCFKKEFGYAPSENS